MRFGKARRIARPGAVASGDQPELLMRPDRLAGLRDRQGLAFHDVVESNQRLFPLS